MAEEVKIVNDSLMCFSHTSVQGRIKNAEFFNKSFSLKTVICPWKILKSLWNLCLKSYEPWAEGKREGAYHCKNWPAKPVKNATFNQDCPSRSALS